MKTMTMKTMLTAGGIGVSCLVLGYVVALLSLKTEILIDYDSGALRQRILVGAIPVRDEPLRDSLFQSYPLPTGEPGLTGHYAWHRAFLFRRGRSQSPNCDAGQVVNDLARVAKWFPSMDESRASQLKHECLQALAKGGESSLRQFVVNTESALLQEYDKH